MKNAFIPPKAAIRPYEMTMHGHTRIDNYYWLNERENPEVLAYLEAENQYADACLKHTKPLQEQLFKEMTGRIKQDDNSVPVKIRDYYHYTRYEEGKEYPLFCRKKQSLEASEEILLDCNALAEGHAFFEIGEVSLSEDDKLLAYSVDTVSRRIYTIYVKNLETGELVGEPIPGTSGNVVWASDNATFFYGVKDETLRPCKIMRHRLGTPAADDVLVYEETDETFVCYINKTKSRKYLIINSESTLSSECRILESDRLEGDFRVFQERQPDMLYGIDHYGEHFYIQTNADGAKNYKIMRTPIGQTEKSNWEEVVPHREQVMIEGVTIFDKFFVIEEREGGLVKIRVKSWDGSTDYYLDFGEPTYTAGVGANPDFEAVTLRYSYNSMTTPSSVYEWDMEQRTKTLLKRQEIVGGFNPEEYVTERLMAPSHDGVLVPISIVYKKAKVFEPVEIEIRRSQTPSVILSGPSTLRHAQGSGTLNRPLVLYGYGSYGCSTDAYFSLARISLLDRGFIWAIAHIRGGEEMGRQWYDDGKMLNKKNTFFDFIACAEYLINKGYTAPQKMFAMGGSAGGLLVGAVTNMRPDLWKGVIAQVPFVDVVTTMLDESIPLTTGEYDEWGNPNEKKYYDYMLSYSPYDNVEVKDYPAMLITTGLHDSQVQYWEPAKWAAKLRALKTDKNPLYLKTEMDYGHGGASGRFEGYKEVALEYAFMLDELGMISSKNEE
jgi:oligopeptidase B